MSVSPAAHIWLASFPKSGNTWFRIFLANLAAGEKGPADINNLDEDGGIASDRREFEAVTFLDSGLMSHGDIDLLRPRVYETLTREMSDLRWTKVHDAYTFLPDGVPMLGRGTARAAIYIVRDPRDVAISLSHHNGTNIEAAIALMNGPDTALCQGRKGMVPQLRQKLLGWSGHVTSWLDQNEVPVHLLRYEDLRADPVLHFSAALAFAGKDASKVEIERAIRHADFAELQRQESEKGFAERISNAAPFFRAGQVGGWRNGLTADQAASLVACHGPVMTRLGYDA